MLVTFYVNIRINKDDIPFHYMTDGEGDMRNHMYKLHEAAFNEKIARNNYVKENAWLDLTSSWSIKDLERVIMDMTAEDPYDSKEWDTMLSVSTHTIKNMEIASAAIMDSLPPKTKKSRHRRHRGLKSKATIGSDSSDSADEKSSKTVDG